MRQAVDQPGLGHGLHPCADQRNDLPSREQPEITVAQRAEGLMDTVQLACGRDSGGKLLKDQRRGCPRAPKRALDYGNRVSKMLRSVRHTLTPMVGPQLCTIGQNCAGLCTVVRLTLRPNLTEQSHFCLYHQ